MSEYEFWDELGNIFNAIVAYQHKTIEFNKRFVNPWLRLGTVFDQNDHNSDALIAARKAIEIDQENGTNWFALGDVYFKMGSFDDAESAYGKAIELNPNLGWAYANLALTKTTRQKYTEAVNLYVKSLELIEDDKDRSMIWNRLGNVYRKVNDYENAFIAFQMADECDGENTGFHDQLDELTLEQRVMPIVAEVYINGNGRSLTDTVSDSVDEPMADEGSETTMSTAVEELEVEEDQIVSADATAAPDFVMKEAQLDMVQEVSANSNLFEGTEQLEAVLDTSVQGTVTEDVIENGFDEGPVDESLEEASQLNVEEEAVAKDVAVEAGELEMVAEVSSDELSAESMPTGVEEDPTVADNIEVQPENVVEDVVVEIAEFEMVDSASVDVPDAEDVKPEAREDVGLDELDEKTTEIILDEPVSDELHPDVVTNDSFDTPNVEETNVVAGENVVADDVSSGDVQIEASTEVQVDLSPAANLTSSTNVDEYSDTENALPVNEVEDREQPAELNFDENITSEASDDVEKTSVGKQINEASLPDVKDTAMGFVDSDASADTTVAFLPSEGTETYADPSSLNPPVVLVVEDLAELLQIPKTEENAPVVDQASKDDTQVDVQNEVQSQSEDLDLDDDVAEVVAEIVALAKGESEKSVDVENVLPDVESDESEISVPIAQVENAQASEKDGSSSDLEVELAYEEYLKNALEPVVADSENPVMKGLKAEPDSKNAHVWNELGNVYFNTGAYEEAIVAYSKAIELDDWFAWPYSNLALVYVQKEKYAEAILLYQRSIELFSSDKDKAVTWNRLGNVYRRLTDYDNAISCYQRADELDPNNATRSLRSRFSLLGSLNLEQSTSVAG